MTALDSSSGRPSKSAKLTSGRQPLSSVGCSSPSSFLENHSLSSLPPRTPSLFSPFLSLSHGTPESPASVKMPHVQFLPREVERSTGPRARAGAWRGRHPLTREEDERMSFLTALNERQTDIINHLCCNWLVFYRWGSDPPSHQFCGAFGMVTQSG